jgi:6-phosphofructokinase 2
LHFKKRLYTTPPAKSTCWPKNLVPEQKIRCGTPRFDAGGGGINVSRQLSRLGGESVAILWLERY